MAANAADRQPILGRAGPSSQPTASADRPSRPRPPKPPRSRRADGHEPTPTAEPTARCDERSHGPPALPNPTATAGATDDADDDNDGDPGAWPVRTDGDDDGDDDDHGGSSGPGGDDGPDDDGHRRRPRWRFRPRWWRRRLTASPSSMDLRPVPRWIGPRHVMMAAGRSGVSDVGGPDAARSATIPTEPSPFLEPPAAVVDERAIVAAVLDGRPRGIPTPGRARIGRRSSVPAIGSSATRPRPRTPHRRRS